MNIKQFFRLLLPITIFISAVNFLYARYQFSSRSGGLEDLASYLVIVLIIVVVVFFILREVMCWYWKINEIVSILKDIQENMTSIRADGKKREQQNNYMEKNVQVEKVKQKTEAEKAEEIEKRKEADAKAEAEKAEEIRKKKEALAKREAELDEERKKKKDDDFFKY